MIDNADLLLTAALAHREQVLAMRPRALRRTLTLKEFVRLARGLDRPGKNRQTLVADVAARRGLSGAAAFGEDDIIDPYRQPIDLARVSAEQIHDAVQDLLVILGPE